MGLCNRDKKEVYTKEEKGISVVKEREGRGAQVYGRTIEEMIYQTLKVTSNGTCVFIRNKNDKKCIVQNYYYLNEQTIKNNYSLPLTLNIVEKYRY